MYINQRQKRHGFATTLLVVGLSLLILGVMIASYKNAVIKHKDTLQHVSKQATQPLLEEEGRDIAEGVVMTIIAGMKGEVDVNTPPIPKPHHYYADPDERVYYEPGQGEWSIGEDGERDWHGTNNRDSRFREAQRAHADAFLNQ